MSGISATDICIYWYICRWLFCCANPKNYEHFDFDFDIFPLCSKQSEVTWNHKVNYCYCLLLSFLAHDWLFTWNTITFHKCFWCSQFLDFHSYCNTFQFGPTTYLSCVKCNACVKRLFQIFQQLFLTKKSKLNTAEWLIIIHFPSSVVHSHFDVMYQTRETVFHRDIQKKKKRVENTTRSGVFLTEFEVFGWPMKHHLKCLIYVLNWNKN